MRVDFRSLTFPPRFQRLTYAVRRGYTLLEVMLASVIALFVLIGLYMYMEVTLRQASEGRDAVERSTLARGIINRLHGDLTPSITPPSAKPKTKTQNSANQTANTNNTNNSNNTNTTGTTTDQSSSTDTESMAATPTTPVPLQAGVIGDSSVLTIYTTRVPDARTFAAQAADPDAPVPSDIRRITYWIGENGGLCRQEIPWLTAENVYATKAVKIDEPDKTDKDYVIAPEVVSLSFEYFDINSTTPDSWEMSWDGSAVGPDNLTPKGPPAAIRVSFTIKYINQRGEEATRDYRHVIPIVTSSGPNTTDQLQSPDASESTTNTTQTGQ